MTERGARAHERYLAAGHAIHTGVAFDQAKGSQCGTPKHLRVGINLRACDHTALAKMLIAKGIITEDEYIEALADEAEAEKNRYEAMLAAKYEVKIKLA